MRRFFHNIMFAALLLSLSVGQILTARATSQSGSFSIPYYSDEYPEGLPMPEEPETKPAVEKPPVYEKTADVINNSTLALTALAPTPQWLPGINSGDYVLSTSGQGFLALCIYRIGLPGDVLYRTYSSAGGWTAWAMNGEHTSWNVSYPSESPRIEAIQIRVTGVFSQYYDIYYATVLSDGTLCGWARNGESSGTMGLGKYITDIRLFVCPKGEFPEDWSTEHRLDGVAEDGFIFGDGLPTFSQGNGQPFTGWAWHENDRYYFVNNTALTGWQYLDGYKYYFQEDGKLVTDLEPVIGANGPYLIKVNKQMNCVTVYVPDTDGQFIIPLKSFLCSTGGDTPIGTFKSPEKLRWQLMVHDVYCQYLTRLGAGLHILLHSPVYSAPNCNTLDADTYNMMGYVRSSGCIRLVTRDAKWIYDHCPVGTTIQVYNSSIVGPYDRPCIDYFIPKTQTWDPTDPDAVALYGVIQQ